MLHSQARTVVTVHLFAGKRLYAEHDDFTHCHCSCRSCSGRDDLKGFMMIFLKNFLFGCVLTITFQKGQNVFPLLLCIFSCSIESIRGVMLLVEPRPPLFCFVNEKRWE